MLKLEGEEMGHIIIYYGSPIEIITFAVDKAKELLDLK